MKAFYTNRPSKLEEVGNGSYLYRYHIEEVDAPSSDQEQRKQWSCDEVVIWSPLTANKITEAVISEQWPLTRELKLVNDYNSTALGLCADNEEEAQQKAQRYLDYLSERKALKEAVDADCAELGIL